MLTKRKEIINHVKNLHFYSFVLRFINIYFSSRSRFVPLPLQGIFGGKLLMLFYIFLLPLLLLFSHTHLKPKKFFIRYRFEALKHPLYIPCWQWGDAAVFSARRDCMENFKNRRNFLLLKRKSHLELYGGGRFHSDHW